MTKRERELDTLLDNIKYAEDENELSIVESNIEFDVDEGCITESDKNQLLLEIEKRRNAFPINIRARCIVFNRQFDELKESAQRLFDDIPDTEENKRVRETLEELINFDFEDSIPEEE